MSLGENLAFVEMPQWAPVVDRRWHKMLNCHKTQCNIAQEVWFGRFSVSDFLTQRSGKSHYWEIVKDSSSKNILIELWALSQLVKMQGDIKGEKGATFCGWPFHYYTSVTFLPIGSNSFTFWPTRSPFHRHPVPLSLSLSLCKRSIHDNRLLFDTWTGMQQPLCWGRVFQQ